MVEKRFQVFVSSTFKDLEEERQEVMHALLELDCMPAGMELFPAANESQWNLIQKVIDDCDYYILILGGRYGSIGPDGFSYTEMEYRYALSTKKPIISFVHKEPGKIIADKTESTAEGLNKLEEFRSLVQQRLCKMWSSPQELGSVVSRSLIQLIKTTPAIGWVRANELADREATLELLRLRRYVEDLQAQLDAARSSAPKGAEDLAQGNEQHSFRFRFKAYEDNFNYQGWNSTFDATWDQIFYAVAPLMINEVSEDKLKQSLNGFAREKSIKDLLEDENFKGLDLKYFEIYSDDFQTIKVQFRALGLISKSEKNRSVKDAGTYWTLTPYGDEVMTRLRAIKRNEDHLIVSSIISQDNSG